MVVVVVVIVIIGRAFEHIFASEMLIYSVNKLNHCRVIYIDNKMQQAIVSNIDDFIN